MKVYTVHAKRYGNDDDHSYIIGVWSDYGAAIQQAEAHAAHRAGKYSCEIRLFSLDGDVKNTRMNSFKVKEASL